jgi:hypothetical protein
LQPFAIRMIWRLSPKVLVALIQDRKTSNTVLRLVVKMLAVLLVCRQNGDALSAQEDVKKGLLSEVAI